MTIAPLDFIDVSHMAAALVMKHSVHFRDDTRRQDVIGSPHHDTETILLRGPAGEVSRESWFADVAHTDMPILAKWPTARQVIEAIAVSHKRRTGGEPVFGKIMVVSLKPGGSVDWHTDQGAYAEAHDRMHICLQPSPGAWLFSGGAQAILPMGQLAYFDNHVLHSAINLGPVPRVHLICDIRRPAPVTIQ